jgi:hypothetical protein
MLSLATDDYNKFHAKVMVDNFLKENKEKVQRSRTTPNSLVRF